MILTAAKNNKNYVIKKKKKKQQQKLVEWDCTYPWGVLIGPLMFLQGGPCLVIHGVLLIFVMDLSLLFRSVLMILSWVLCLLLMYLCNFSAFNKYLSLIKKKIVHILASQSSKLKLECDLSLFTLARNTDFTSRSVECKTASLCSLYKPGLF